MSRYIFSRTYRKRILAALIGLFVLFAGSYAYFLQSTVQHVVERKNLDNQIAALHSEIGDAEYNYSASVSEVTMKKAEAMGFESVEDTTYVTRADRSTLASLNVSGQ